jgi:hypothetical protein
VYHDNCKHPVNRIYELLLLVVWLGWCTCVLIWATLLIFTSDGFAPDGQLSECISGFPLIISRFAVDLLGAIRELSNALAKSGSGN